MIPEAGQISLMLAFVLSMIQGFVVMAGVIRKDDRLMALAKPATHLTCLSVAAAYASLTYAFVTSDFSVRYVAEHSNTLLPMFYKVAAVWGGHEGSMLLWALILTMWSLAVSLFSRNLPRETVAAVLAVMGLLAVGFLAFLIFASNPFERIFPALTEGRDLNPLLQDPGMVFHPPMLYMGYVGFSVAFSFAIAALILGRLDAAWARWSRPWTTVAWVFLTLGIALGSWWAYYELGWGGWWFWDPVENASFMPWLVGTALIHSLAVTEKRGAFKNWTVMLAILAFSLSLLGTFLVRSGILTSVHAFATDPRRGIFILSFLSITVGLSLWLFAWRAGKVSRGGAFEPVSREALLLVNNVLLTVAAASVLLGTLYPLLLDALGMGKISVGPPYFEAVFVPLMIPLFLIIGVGPFMYWRKSHWRDLPSQLMWVAGATLGISAIIPFILGRWSVLVAVGLVLGLWTIVSSLATVFWRGQARATSLLQRARSVTRAQWGMILAHAGVGVVILGITLVKGYETSLDVKMNAGTTARLGEHVFIFNSVEEVKGPNYVAMRGHLEVHRDDRKLVDLYPEKRVYTVQRMPMTEAAIDSGMFRDLYVSLGEQVDIQTWIVRIQHKPLVGWIWWGCVLMAVGGLLAASDRRYRLARRSSSESARAMAGEYGSA